jgi:hypothetical protein
MGRRGSYEAVRALQGGPAVRRRKPDAAEIARLEDELDLRERGPDRVRIEWSNDEVASLRERLSALAVAMFIAGSVLALAACHEGHVIWEEGHVVLFIAGLLWAPGVAFCIGSAVYVAYGFVLFLVTGRLPRKHQR